MFRMTKIIGYENLPHEVAELFKIAAIGFVKY